MSHVIEACCTFLEQQLEAGNAIGIASFAQQHGCMDLYRKANTFIEQHFSEVRMWKKQQLYNRKSSDLETSVLNVVEVPLSILW